MGLFSLPSLTGLTPSFSSSNKSWIDDPNNPTLVGLPTPIAPVRPNSTTTATPTTTTLDSPLLAGANKLLSYFGANNTAVSTTATGGATISSTWLGRGVFIVLGLLLIAAGVFSFNKSQTVIKEFGKGVVEGATAA